MAAALEGLAAIAESEGDVEPASVFREEAAALRAEVPQAPEADAPADPEPQGRLEGSGETTATLLAMTRSGDERARSRLAARYVSVLRRFAHGRLPARARDMGDTGDLVQITIQRALAHLHDFKPRREGAFLAYLRRILVNQVRDEVRRVSRRPERVPLNESIPDPGTSPLRWVEEREVMERYEACLQHLSEEQRSAVVLHLEAGMSHPEVALSLGKRSADAARMLVRRGVMRLRDLMGEGSRPGA